MEDLIQTLECNPQESSQKNKEILKFMAMEVETLSTETIKPSQATPSHLRMYKICLLDQLVPPLYVPVVLFYAASDIEKSSYDMVSVSQKLKTSLSETLSSFYPFCGRLKENAFIDCSDEGVVFMEAIARFLLSEVLADPNIQGLQKFLPFPHYKPSSEEEPILGVKVSFFECGGVGIGVCVSHKIADGCSLGQFLVSWAQTALGLGFERPQARFDASTVFRPRDVSFPMPEDVISSEKLVTKRFRFSGKALAWLRAKFSGLRPTRVEALTALIWKTSLEAAKVRPGSSGLFPPSAATHVVNIRSRAAPPLPQQTLGNLWQSVIALMTDTDKEALQLQDLLAPLRKSITRMNGDYVTELQGDNGLAKACESLMAARKLTSRDGAPVELYRFSSWARFPFYEVDFGWGRPEWVCTTSVPVKNVIILMGTGSGDEGIEAWITLTEADMIEFEANEKLLRFITVPNH